MHLRLIEMGITEPIRRDEIDGDMEHVLFGYIRLREAERERTGPWA